MLATRLSSIKKTNDVVSGIGNATHWARSGWRYVAIEYAQSLQIPGGAFEGLAGLLGSVPDNAFQRARAGESYDVKTRGLAVLLGGLKLFCVGFISSIGTLSLSNGVWAVRKTLHRDLSQKPAAKRSPVFKTAFAYGSFLGLSANLRYQVIWQHYFH
jgi:hypothetical protein